MGNGSGGGGTKRGTAEDSGSGGSSQKWIIVAVMTALLALMLLGMPLAGSFNHLQCFFLFICGWAFVLVTFLQYIVHPGLPSQLGMI
jgi:CBS domain containing-hemolysin-like protein